MRTAKTLGRCKDTTDIEQLLADQDTKSGAGRPKMPDYQKRNKQLKIYLTAAEIQALKLAAEEQGRSVSSLATQAVKALIK